MVTVETLTRHELVGLEVAVVSASNPDLVGHSGEVVEETAKTLGIERDDSRVVQVPKADATFGFELPSGGGVTVVTVEGERLLARPARRSEQTGDSKWR